MTRRPGRLYRRLHTGVGMVAVNTEQLGTLSDSAVTSITLHRGSDSPDGGLHPSTLEVVAPGALYTGNNTQAYFRLQTTFANRIAALDPTKATSGTQIRDRFIGRVGATEVEDRGGLASKGFTTTFKAAHWSSLVMGASRKVQPTKGETVNDLLKRALKHTDLGSKIGTVGIGGPDTIAATTEWTKASEVIDTYGAGTGTQIREMRQGDLWILPIGRRRFELFSTVATTLPVLRAEGIAPARWSQPIEAANRRLSITRVVSSGAPYTQDWPFPLANPASLAEPELVDWSNIVAQTESPYEHYRYYMNALNQRYNVPVTRLQSVRFDLIRLLTSTVPYDRRIAMWLLKLEVGEPVLIGADWPAAIQGAYTAQGITERMDKDTWEIELALHSVSSVMGVLYSERPTIPAYTWDQVRTPWNSTPGAWNDYQLPA
ncbi:hypothetical protein [Kocuria sp.]|uniref:hypothetical protein n=1 Tax=Kocuria sp. TaxID=1871328 RepID=UPI0026DFBF0B|nr:hypothetical protein [Kocuria sp.]MDO5618018.1 hypothetical protein [Kocuria sp.]